MLRLSGEYLSGQITKKGGHMLKVLCGDEVHTVFSKDNGLSTREHYSADVRLNIFNGKALFMEIDGTRGSGDEEVE